MNSIESELKGELRIAIEIFTFREIKHRITMESVNGGYSAKLEVAEACMKDGWMEINSLDGALKWLASKIR